MHDTHDDFSLLPPEAQELLKGAEEAVQCVIRANRPDPTKVAVVVEKAAAGRARVSLVERTAIYGAPDAEVPPHKIIVIVCPFERVQAGPLLGIPLLRPLDHISPRWTKGGSA